MALPSFSALSHAHLPRPFDTRCYILHFISNNNKSHSMLLLQLLCEWYPPLSYTIVWLKSTGNRKQHWVTRYWNKGTSLATWTACQFLRISLLRVLWIIQVLDTIPHYPFLSRHVVIRLRTVPDVSPTYLYPIPPIVIIVGLVL